MLILTSSASKVADQLKKKIGSVGKTLFVKTAAEVYPGNPDWLEADRQAVYKFSNSVTDYSFDQKIVGEVEADFDKVDCIFLAGGNIFYLLDKIRESKSEGILLKMVKEKIVIGSSAGSVVFCNNLDPIKFFDDPSVSSRLDKYKGLGLFDFLLVPHCNQEEGNSELIDLIKYNFSKCNQQLILLGDSNYIIYNQSLEFY
ncbi:Type 1 glutamine amidotransferase-like domain-containing protein [Candidatus Dojkabacteria bacterium]|nr:Type 1 glutamine amidotransferase-like domain-containing protein [Candidatus Dojkabacteria bacterium]